LAISILKFVVWAIISLISISVTPSIFSLFIASCPWSVIIISTYIMWKDFT
jgi:hypothetical protein